MKITRTLANSQAATFCIELPNNLQNEMITPTGTGFFVSPEGWFVTAAHVITKNHKSDGPVRQDIDKAWLQKEIRQIDGPSVMCQFVSFSHVIPRLDFALLKIDFQKNSSKEWLSGQNSFPFIGISSRELEEGEAVYAFGYPLSTAFSITNDRIRMSSTTLCPRVTSAIVSSTINESGMISTSDEPKVYVLDKALNYGNSGGPIISEETGRVHAFCSRFQPVYIPQDHILDMDKKLLNIMVPSLYGVVSSLGNPEIIGLLQNLKVTIYED